MMHELVPERKSEIREQVKRRVLKLTNHQNKKKDVFQNKRKKRAKSKLDQFQKIANQCRRKGGTGKSNARMKRRWGGKKRIRKKGKKKKGGQKEVSIKKGGHLHIKDHSQNVKGNRTTWYKCENLGTG